ncbi:preprotein translocase subunit SecY, partial [Buchnera aphidicola (Hormaphis cornu)]
SCSISIGLSNVPGFKNLIIDTTFDFYLVSSLSLVTGTIFLMWLGELITDYGIGNGISMIIFSGIIAGLPFAMVDTIEQTRQGILHLVSFVFLVILVFFVTYLVVFIETSQRNIDVCYAKRQKGRQIYAAQNTHLPLKLNVSGVIPAIFASSILMFPSTIIAWFGRSDKWNVLFKMSKILQPNCFFYTVLYAIFIVFFCFFYTGLVFNSRDTANNLKKSGAFVPGIRPGEKTSDYINKIMLRLTLISSIYITFICLMPELIRNFLQVSFHFGGTSLLIVVVVIIEFINQLQTLVLSTQYESILKKSNLNFKK